MDVLEQFKKNWKKNFSSIQPKNSHLLLAVSGGVDSVVLTHLVAAIGFDFTIVHCNFQLRGNESNNDELFVQSLGDKYSKQVLVNHFSTQQYADEQKTSIQVAARELRYHWFEELSQNSSYLNCKIVTAHHADDNIETVLMNIFRGTGISGLHGILPIQKNVLRPLLFTNKESIIAYANDQHLNWVEDTSNSSDKYTRNYFRHHVIPIVKEVFVNAEANLLANIERWKEVEQVYSQSIELIKLKLLEFKGNEIHLPILKLQKQAPLNTIVFEIIKDYGFTAAQVKDVIQLLHTDNSNFVASLSYRIIKNRNWLIIAPINNIAVKNILIESNETAVIFEAGTLGLKLLDESTAYTDNNCLVQLDANLVKFPLLLRKWKIGDYFYPLGMQKKKKINRFLIDKKLSTTQKEKVWVIESNQKIIWVVGQRIDNRFKLLNSSKKILQLQFLPSLA